MVSTNLPNNAEKGRLKRWCHHLNPDLTREKWTEEENLKLFELHSRFGSQWKEISSNFLKRTDNGIKNQFFSIIRKSLRKICKYTGISLKPITINSIKPKILSNFLNTMMKVESEEGASNPEKTKIKMSDVVQKFAFDKSPELENSSRTDLKSVLTTHISLLNKSKLSKKYKICG